SHSYDAHSLTSLSTYPSTHQIYTPSLHDALPIYEQMVAHQTSKKKTVVDKVPTEIIEKNENPSNEYEIGEWVQTEHIVQKSDKEDRKSTRLNSSHVKISYAVFCLKKKKKKNKKTK